MFRNMFLGSAMFNPLRSPDGVDGVEQTGGNEEAPIVAVEEAAVKAAEAAKAADEAKAKEQAELALEEKPEPKPEKDWRDKELAKKHAQLKEKDRKEAELQQRIKDLEAIAARVQSTEEQPEPRVAPVATTPRIDADAVRIEAERIVREQDFNRSVQAAETKGKEIYKEGFDKAVETLSTLGGFDPETLAGILATDDPSKVLYELGSKPDEYHRIMELPAAKRTVELVKIAMVTTPKPKVSDAPAPVEQVGGRGGSNTANELRDDLSDDEWNSIRDRQERERWAKKNGRAA